MSVDGHAEVPIQSVRDLQEPEEEDTSPSHSLSWSSPGGCHLAALI